MSTLTKQGSRLQSTYSRRRICRHDDCERPDSQPKRRRREEQGRSGAGGLGTLTNNQPFGKAQPEGRMSVRLQQLLVFRIPANPLPGVPVVTTRYVPPSSEERQAHAAKEPAHISGGPAAAAVEQ
jgi:hypothetical protein